MFKWTTSKLGDIAVFEKGRKVETLPAEHGGWLPYLGASAIGGKITAFANPENAVVVSENDLLLLWDGERSGLVGRAVRGVAGSTVARVTPRGVDSGFLYYSLQRSYPWIQARRTGTGIPHVPSDLGDWLKITYPVSLKEQSLISQILFTLDTQIQKTEALIAKLEKFKEGLLHDLLTRGIDENGQLRPRPEQAPELYKESPLGVIPREWVPSSGAQACKEIVVGIVIKPTQYYRASGVPILRSANVRENRLSLDNLMYMSQQDHKAMSKSSVNPGDVLTVRTGYPGTSCVVDGSLEEANCVDIIISRVGEELDPNFWALWINSDFGKGHVLKSQGGLAQQHFNVGDLKKIQLPIPAMLEQMKIVGTWKALQEQIQKESTRLEKLQLQKIGLMDDLLTGRIRVTPLLEKA